MGGGGKNLAIPPEMKGPPVKTLSITLTCTLAFLLPISARPLAPQPGVAVAQESRPHFCALWPPLCGWPF